MTYLLTYCVILFAITFIGIKLFIKVAPSIGLVDIPNGRSSHKKIMPRGAGLVFGLTFILAITFYEFEKINEHIMTIAAILIIYLCGIIDDKFDMSAKKKLLIIFIASTLAYFDGYQITTLGNFFGINLNLGYLALPFTILAIAGFTNAINLSDGLDGLAGSLSVIMLTSIFAIGVIYEDMLIIAWSALLISVILAFLFFNWYPAKVFMGDSGSLLLGFSIALLAIRTLEYVNPVSTLFLAAIPILDTLIVSRRRIQRGISPFVADKNHVHHILNNMKKDKAFTVNMLISIQIIFSTLFIQIHDKRDEINLVLFYFLFLVFFNLFDPRIRRRPDFKKYKKRYKKKLKEKKLAEELENTQA